MQNADLSSVEFLSVLLKRCLDEGHPVKIDRLGVFSHAAGNRVEFTPARKPRVFVAYAAEDSAVVKRLCDRLELDGIDAWLDRRRLLPGDDWKRAIFAAIRNADFFIACLTRRSLTKRGTFQAELRQALEWTSQVPLDDLYLMPVRLEECRVPGRISAEVQYVDLFPDFEAGVRRLIAAITLEWARRLQAA
jgi:hypothetical protein